MRVRSSDVNSYVRLELAIGVWTWATAWLIPLSDNLVTPLLGVDPSAAYQWTVVFGVVLLALLPATTAMGATLPAAERFLTHATQRHTTGLLYGANTAGAMAGALAAAFWMMPAMGIRGCLVVFGALSIVCGGAAFSIRRCQENVHGVAQGDFTDTRAPLRLAVRLFLGGVLGIGFEAVMIHALAQVLENTVYTFAIVLGTYLFGTALGAALYHSAQKRGGEINADHILCALVLAVGVAGATLRWTPGLYKALRSGLGDSIGAVALAEAGIAAFIFVVPTILMGALWTALAQQSLRQKRSLAWGVALNTTGAAFAPLLFGAVGIPTVGLHVALAALPVGYAALVRGRKRMIVSLVLGIAAVPLQTSILHLTDTGGGRLLTLKEGMMGTVAVIENSGGERVLKFNNRFQMGGTAARVAEKRQAHIPLLLHHNPRRALFIGLGTGITFSAAKYYQDLTADGIELVPEIAEATRYFRTENETESANLRIWVADGRRFVRATDQKYDVIVADLFHPGQDGAGFLYTFEHFDAIRRRLNDQGVFCQWLPVYQMDIEAIEIVTATFANVFPECEIWLLRFNLDVPVIGLIARVGSAELRSSLVEEKARDNPALAENLKQVGLNDTLRLLGCYLGKVEAGRSAKINSDLDPIMIFRAPALTLRRQDDAGERLLKVLGSYTSAPEGIVSGNEEFLHRFKLFIAARDIYLGGLQKQHKKQLAEAVEAYVRSAALSEDFTAGYAQALTIATGMSQQRPQEAVAILRRLIEARPERPVAGELLRRLENGSVEK